jgi:3-methyladenine DNA glycosylase Mpg
MYIEDRGVRIAQDQMQCTPRIGISQAKEHLWRFCYGSF